MASTARLAVRFFGTIHHRVDAVKKEGASLISPERFPAVLATSAFVGLMAGWQIMDRIENARAHDDLDNAEPYHQRYQHIHHDGRRARAPVQRRYTLAAVRPVAARAVVDDPRASSLWASASVE